VDEVALVVFHGIDNDVELFGDIADDGFRDFIFFLFNFGHKVSLSANSLPADSVVFCAEHRTASKGTSPTYYINTLF
jgi:hypothetical protein